MCAATRAAQAAQQAAGAAESEGTMASFPDPFAGSNPPKISKADLIQAIRLDIVGELEAMYLYDAHSQATDDPVAKKVLADIRDEEREHFGELVTLLRYLAPDEFGLFLEGQGEVAEMIEELGISYKLPEHS
jgi:rubrerythrin